MQELSANPWEWPDLMPEQVRELSESDPGTGPETPLFQYFAVRRCNDLRVEIDAGSGFAVLAAVRICGTHGLVMPEWLSYAFNRRYDAVLNCRASSWDDPMSFGKPYPKGTNIKARHKARMMRFAVLNAINDIRNKEKGAPIDKRLFERVGGQLFIGATLAEEYYYAAKRIGAALDGNDHGAGAALLESPHMSPTPNTAKKRKTAGIQMQRR